MKNLVTRIVDWCRPYAKAVAGAVVGAVLPFVTLLATTGTVNWHNVLSAAVGAAVGALGVYHTPNKPKRARKSRAK